jgi:hypothetical protein
VKKIALVSSSILSVFVLTACGGGGSSNSDRQSNSSQSANGIPSSFVGVWDASTDEGVDGFDQYYLSIDASGKISTYDFAGDTFDDWGNCYWIEKDVYQLKSLGGSKYRSTAIYAGSNGEFEDLEITVSGGELTSSSKDVDDVDDDGNTTESYTETIKKSSRTVQSFTPECVDSFAAARSLIPAKQAKSSSLVQ